MPIFRLRLLSMLLGLTLVLAGCPNRREPVDDDDAGDDAAGDDDDDDTGDDDTSGDDDDTGDDDTSGDDDTAPPCPEGTRFCDGTVVMECDADELPVFVQDCAPEEACYAGSCDDPCAVVAAQHSYLGCDFLAVSTLNTSLSAGFATDFAVVVGVPAGSEDAEVTVTRGGNAAATQTVLAGSSAAIQLPMVPALQVAGGGLFSNASSATVVGGAYEVHSSVPIVAYQFNPLHFTTGALAYSYSNDASLLLPEHSMTGEYRVLTWNTWPYTPWVSYRGYAAIAGTEDGTSVTITASSQTADGDPAALSAGQSTTVLLDRGDVVQILSGPGEDDDLTGTTISATAPVATFVGHDCTYMPVEFAACDHLEEMAFPVETWGTTVVLSAPQHPDGLGAAPARYRIQGRMGGVGLTFEPSVQAAVTLGLGEILEFETAQDFVVTAAGQIQVTQTMLGQDALGAVSGGDPALGTGVPWSQTRASYDFLVPATYTTNWLNVVALTGAPIRLDGALVTGWVPVGSSGYDAARVAVGVGSHEVASDDGSRFGITAYGYAQYTSYLYPAGLNFLR